MWFQTGRITAHRDQITVKRESWKIKSWHLTWITLYMLMIVIMDSLPLTQYQRSIIATVPSFFSIVPYPGGRLPPKRTAETYHFIMNLVNVSSIAGKSLTKIYIDKMNMDCLPLICLIMNIFFVWTDLSIRMVCATSRHVEREGHLCSELLHYFLMAVSEDIFAWLFSDDFEIVEINCQSTKIP